MQTQGMDLDLQQRSTVRQLNTAALDVIEHLLTDEQKNSRYGLFLVTAVREYALKLPFGPQPFDREAAEKRLRGEEVKTPKKLTQVMQDILLAYERQGPMIDQALVPYLNGTLGRNYKPQSIRGARANLVRMGHAYEAGSAKNSSGKSCSLWGTSGKVRQAPEPTRSEEG